MQEALSRAHIREGKESKCDRELIKLKGRNRHPINKGEAHESSILVKDRLDMDQLQLLTAYLSEEEETVEVDLFHNIEVTNHNVDQEPEVNPQEFQIVDGDSQTQNLESNPAHAEVDEEIDLTEVADLEEAEEEVLDILPAFTVKARIMMKGTALKMSSVISRNAEPISADAKKNSRKDRQLGHTLLNQPKVKLTRLKKDSHRL